MGSWPQSYRVRGSKLGSNTVCWNKNSLLILFIQIDHSHSFNVFSVEIALSCIYVLCWCCLRCLLHVWIAGAVLDDSVLYLCMVCIGYCCIWTSNLRCVKVFGFGELSASSTSGSIKHLSLWFLYLTFIWILPPFPFFLVRFFSTGQHNSTLRNQEIGHPC